MYKFLSQNVQTCGHVSHDINDPKFWANIQDPVVPLERNLYGRPLAGLLWERKFEEASLELGWEEITELGMYVRSKETKVISVSTLK